MIMPFVVGAMICTASLIAGMALLQCSRGEDDTNIYLGWVAAIISLTFLLGFIYSAGKEQMRLDYHLEAVEHVDSSE